MSMMDRIRSLSQSGTPTSTPKPKPVISSSSSSPEPSREGTLFTPTADDELEAILSVDVSSGRGTPDMSVIESKSGLGTRTPSMVSPLDDISDVESTHVRAHMKRIKEVEDEAMSTFSMSIAGAETEEEEELEELEGREISKDVKDSKEDADTGLPSTVKFSSQLMVAEVPGRSSSVGMSASNLDMSKSPVVSSMGFSAEMRAMFSREALMEREKVTTDAKTSFFGLDARYKDMADDLFRLDNSYLPECETPDQIGEVVQNVIIVSTQTPDIIIGDFDESFPVEDENGANSDSEILQASKGADIDTVQPSDEVKHSGSELRTIPSIIVNSPQDSENQYSGQDISRETGCDVGVEKSTEINPDAEDYDATGKKSPIDIIITAASESSSASSSSEPVDDPGTC